MRFCKKKSDGTFEVISEIFNIFLDILSMFWRTAAFTAHRHQIYFSKVIEM
jgi:hypothetical protein